MQDELPPTHKQLEAIRKFRISTFHIKDRDTAHRVLQAIEDNGWHRPDNDILAQIIVGDVPDDDDFGDVDDHG